MKALLTILLVSQLLSPNWTYTNTKYSYSISISNEWKQIPPSEIIRVSKLVDPDVKYNEGFYKKDFQQTNNYFTCPYILTQFHSLDMKENEYDKIAEELSKNQKSLKIGFDETKQKFSNYIEKNDFSGKSFYNKTKHRLYIPLKMKLKNLEETYSCSIMIFCKKGFFQLSLYSKKSTFIKDLENIEYTLDSFKYLL